MTNDDKIVRYGTLVRLGKKRWLTINKKGKRFINLEDVCWALWVLTGHNAVDIKKDIESL